MLKQDCFRSLLDLIGRYISAFNERAYPILIQIYNFFDNLVYATRTFQLGCGNLCKSVPQLAEMHT